MSEAPKSPTAMRKKQCCCDFQRYVSEYFYNHGALVARWPLPFVLVPFVFTVACTYVFMSHFKELAHSGTGDAAVNEMTMYTCGGSGNSNRLTVSLMADSSLTHLNYRHPPLVPARRHGSDTFSTQTHTTFSPAQLVSRHV
jgi:hypothetical protein